MRENEKWYAKIIFDNEGVDDYGVFATKEEADAYAIGFQSAAEIASTNDDSSLEDYYTVVVDQIEPVDE